MKLPELTRYEDAKRALIEIRRVEAYLNNATQEALKVLMTARAGCTHTWDQVGEGRHGSDKGVRFFTCRACGCEKEE